MGKFVSSIHSEEDLEKIRRTGIETFKFVRKGAPAYNTRSRQLKFLYEGVDDVPTHLKTEWKIYLARKMYHDIVKNNKASLDTKNEIAEIYYNLKNACLK